MAVVNRKSTGVTNTDATPAVINNPGRSTQVLKHAQGVVASAADDSATSVGRFFRIPSNASGITLRLFAAIASSAGAIDIGLHAVSGGAAVDADFFATAVSLSAAAQNGVDVTHESGTYTYAFAEGALWAALGLASDPCCDYDVSYTISTTFNGGPTSILLKGTFVA